MYTEHDSCRIKQILFLPPHKVSFPTLKGLSRRGDLRENQLQATLLSTEASVVEPAARARRRRWSPRGPPLLALMEQDRTAYRWACSCRELPSSSSQGSWKSVVRSPLRAHTGLHFLVPCDCGHGTPSGQ